MILKSRYGGSDYSYTISDIQVEYGKASTYASYKTPIELCKIGDYKDRIYKDNGTWYLEKNIGKVILDGSESGWANDSSGKLSGLTISDIKNYSSAGAVIEGYCNYYQNGSLNTARNNANQYCCYSTSNTSKLYFNNNSMSVSDFKTWLSNNNVIVYYVLETPTTTEITDTELLTQLENWYNTKSNKDTTYISVTSGDLPAILNVKALKKYE